MISPNASFYLPHDSTSRSTIATLHDELEGHRSVWKVLEALGIKVKLLERLKKTRKLKPQWISFRP